MCISALKARLAKRERRPQRVLFRKAGRDAGIINQIPLFVLPLHADGECHVDTTTTAGP